MKSFIRQFFGPARPKAVFADDGHDARAMRIAELKWLLAEIAAPEK